MRIRDRCNKRVYGQHQCLQRSLCRTTGDLTVCMQAGLEKADLRVEVSVQEHRRLKKQLAAQRATLDASGGKLWHQMCQLASSAP